MRLTDKETRHRLEVIRTFAAISAGVFTLASFVVNLVILTRS